MSRSNRDKNQPPKPAFARIEDGTNVWIVNCRDETHQQFLRLGPNAKGVVALGNVHKPPKPEEPSKPEKRSRSWVVPPLPWKKKQ